MRQVIHIKDDKVNVIEHLREQPNMSGYIVSLIEKDMNNKGLDREEVIKIIQDYLGGSSSKDASLMSSINDCLSL